MTLETRLSEIESRIEAATPGKWELSKSYGSYFEKPEYLVNQGWEVDAETRIVRKAPGQLTVPKKGDAELIAHAPTDLRSLCQALRVAERALQAYAKSDEQYFGHTGIRFVAREALAEMAQVMEGK